jgi:hypothetical protein
MGGKRSENITTRTTQTKTAFKGVGVKRGKKNLNKFLLFFLVTPSPIYFSDPDKISPTPIPVCLSSGTFRCQKKWSEKKIFFFVFLKKCYSRILRRKVDQIGTGFANPDSGFSKFILAI